MRKKRLAGRVLAALLSVSMSINMTPAMAMTEDFTDEVQVQNFSAEENFELTDDASVQGFFGTGDEETEATGEITPEEQASSYLEENYVTNNKIITNGGDSVIKSSDGLTYEVGMRTPSGSSITSLNFKREGSTSSYKSGWYLDADEKHIKKQKPTYTRSRTILKRDTTPYSFTATLKLFSSDTDNSAIDNGTAIALASQDFTIILLPEAAKYNVTFQVVNKNTQEAIAGAKVTLEKGWSEVSTESDGSYLLPGDETYSLTVTADGYQKYKNGSFQASANGEVKIELAPIVTHRITFEVKDSKGNIISDAKVSVKKVTMIL